MNKRLIAFLSILSLFLSTPLIPANAAAKAGAKCTKAGSTEVVKSKSYTCIKSGKKLVWNKGVKEVTARKILSLQQKLIGFKIFAVKIHLFLLSGKSMKLFYQDQMFLAVPEAHLDSKWLLFLIQPLVRQQLREVI